MGGARGLRHGFFFLKIVRHGLPPHRAFFKKKLEVNSQTLLPFASKSLHSRTNSLQNCVRSIPQSPPPYLHLPHLPSSSPQASSSATASSPQPSNSPSALQRSEPSLTARALPLTKSYVLINRKLPPSFLPLEFFFQLKRPFCIPSCNEFCVHPMRVI